MADGTTPRGASGVVHQILVANVRPSPTQPRRHGRDGADLVESIREHGVLSPIWVRTLNPELAFDPGEDDPDDLDFEVIFGERRRNASAAADLERIPAEIHDELSDEEVAVIQAEENLNRRDVSPLEEAESYRILRDQFKLSPEAIAARLHRDERAVRRGLRLLTLGEEARKALDEGLLTVDAALLLAAVEEPEAQREAVKAALDHGRGEPVGRRYASALIRGRFTLEMAAAPWPRGDAKLLPAAGPCTTCPKRTGSQLALLVELDREDDRCTDRKCWSAKMDAHWARVAAAAKARGAQVVDGKEAEKYYPNAAYLVRGKDRLFDLAEICWPVENEKDNREARELQELRAAGRGEEAERKEQEYFKAPRQTWRDLLGDRLLASIVVRDPAGGVHELAREEEGLALLRADGLVPPAPAPSSRSTDPDEDDEESDEEGETRPPSPPAAPKKATVEELVDQRALAEIVKSAHDRAVSLSLWRFLVALTIHAADAWDVLAVVKRRELAEKPTAITAPPLLLAAVEKMGGEDCRAVLVELLITGADPEEERSPAAVAARFFGVERAKIRERIEREQKASAQPQKPPADNVRPPVLKGDAAAPPVPPHPALGVDCDTCPSKVGAGCVTSKGLPRSPHVSREKLAQAAATSKEVEESTGEAKPKTRVCGTCGQPGHNARTCGRRA